MAKRSSRTTGKLTITVRATIAPALLTGTRHYVLLAPMFASVSPLPETMIVLRGTKAISSATDSPGPHPEIRQDPKTSARRDFLPGVLVWLAIQTAGVVTLCGE